MGTNHVDTPMRPNERDREIVKAAWDLYKRGFSPSSVEIARVIDAPAQSIKVRLRKLRAYGVLVPGIMKETSGTDPKVMELRRQAEIELGEYVQSRIDEEQIQRIVEALRGKE